MYRKLYLFFVINKLKYFKKYIKKQLIKEKNLKYITMIRVFKKK